jgi:hypothetical protein
LIEGRFKTNLDGRSLDVKRPTQELRLTCPFNIILE